MFKEEEGERGRTTESTLKGVKQNKFRRIALRLVENPDAGILTPNETRRSFTFVLMAWQASSICTISALVDIKCVM